MRLEGALRTQLVPNKLRAASRARLLMRRGDELAARHRLAKVERFGKCHRPLLLLLLSG